MCSIFCISDWGYDKGMDFCSCTCFNSRFIVLCMLIVIADDLIFEVQWAGDTQTTTERAVDLIVDGCQHYIDIALGVVGMNEEDQEEDVITASSDPLLIGTKRRPIGRLPNLPKLDGCKPLPLKHPRTVQFGKAIAGLRFMCPSDSDSPDSSSPKHPPTTSLSSTKPRAGRPPKAMSSSSSSSLPSSTSSSSSSTRRRSLQSKATPEAPLGGHEPDEAEVDADVEAEAEEEATVKCESVGAVLLPLFLLPALSTSRVNPVSSCD